MANKKSANKKSANKKSASKKSANKKSANKAPWIALVVLALIGIGLSVYLTYIHYNVHTNPNFSASCDASKTVSCSRVALSSYAITAGIPTSVLGIIGYLFVLLVGLFGWFRKSLKASHLHGMIIFLTTACFCAGVFYAYVSITEVKAICPQCMGTYAINIILLFVGLYALRSDGVSVTEGIQALFLWLPRGFLTLLIAGIFVAGVAIGYPKYWDSKWQGLSLPTNVCKGTLADADIAHGEDKEKNHWIGAKNPKLTIVEFADYECPYCKIAHFKLRALLRRCSSVIRLYHRHYPLDHKCNPNISRPFHKKACQLARAAYCAGKQGKFWEANDFLYRKGKKTPKGKLVEEMTKLGLQGDKLQTCIQSKEAREAINRDMAAGRGHKMNGTPFFLMNNKPYRKGYIPEKTIIKELESIDTSSPAPKASQPKQRSATPTRKASAPKAPARKASAPKAPARKASAPKAPARKAPAAVAPAPRLPLIRSITPPRAPVPQR